MDILNSNAVYKLGKELYNDVDKNSGLYEYNIVKNRVASARINDTLIIINGKLTKADEKVLPSILSKYKKKIFICSDAIAFEDNKSIIKECDILLHQCPYNKLPNIPNHIIQHYSYVPELFYAPYTQVKQDDLLFYGGGLRNTVTLDYLQSVPSKSLIKDNKQDNRLNYYEYLDELATHKFALIIGRQVYNELGWVTSRFVEAAACWNYPIVDIDYDRHQYFGMTKMINMTDVRNTIDKLSKDELSRITKIKYYRHRFNNDFNNFTILLEELSK